MNKKQWFVLFCLLIMYILMGAVFYYYVQYQLESETLAEEMVEKIQIQKLFGEIFNKSAPVKKQKALFDNLSAYCGKTVTRNMTGVPEVRRWDFYHSLFFVITVVTTIGYGNLAPTSSFGRIFMIFYSLIGVPLNGIVMATLATFFAKSFTKLYQRWKSSKKNYDPTRLGLISQIVLYLVPGFTFFIFLPAAIMVFFEGWSYDLAVYYCFVTLSTIGFGDYVAGVTNVNNYGSYSYWSYKIFLLVWIAGGLGYVIMILTFISQAMRSKKIKALELAIRQNIKKTPVKIREELRTMLTEFLFMRVKPVYKGQFDYQPTVLERTQSCPDLTIYRSESPGTKRQRAFSECPRNLILHRIHSEADLERIDKDLTFQQNEDFLQQQSLIMKVVDALGNIAEENHQQQQQQHGAYDGFTDEEILASEKFGSRWSLTSLQPPPLQLNHRRRAVSEIKAPERYEAHNPDLTWSGYEAQHNLQEFRNLSDSGNFLTRIKKRLLSTSSASSSNDLEKQPQSKSSSRRNSLWIDQERSNYLKRTAKGRPSLISMQMQLQQNHNNQESVLEQTSIADFIRALSAITVPESLAQNLQPPKQRKLGTAGLASPPKVPSPPRTRRTAIRPNVQSRRNSVMPPSEAVNNISSTGGVNLGGARERRRFSLRPVDENLLITPPPPYSPPRFSISPYESRYSNGNNNNNNSSSVGNRRYSRSVGSTGSVPQIVVSPVQRQVNKKDNKEQQE